MSPRRLLLVLVAVIGFSAGNAFPDTVSQSPPPIAAPAMGFIDAGSGSVGSGSAVPAPTAATLSDPTSNPVAAYHELVALKGRWPLLVFAVLVLLAKLAHYAGDKFGAVGRWLAVGKRSMYLAAVGGLAASCFDSLASGGTWSSVALVAGAALLALLSPHKADAA